MTFFAAFFSVSFGFALLAMSGALVAVMFGFRGYDYIRQGKLKNTTIRKANYVCAITGTIVFGMIFFADWAVFALVMGPVLVLVLALLGLVLGYSAALVLKRERGEINWMYIPAICALLLVASYVILLLIK